MDLDSEIEDDDMLDGCDIDFAAEADDEATQAMRPLFPTGVADPELAQKYRRLGGAEP